MFGLELMTCIANLAWRDLLLFACLINWIFQQKLAVLEKVLCVSYVTCRNSLGGATRPYILVFVGLLYMHFCITLKVPSFLWMFQQNLAVLHVIV